MSASGWLVLSVVFVISVFGVTSALILPRTDRLTWLLALLALAGIAVPYGGVGHKGWLGGQSQGPGQERDRS